METKLFNIIEEINNKGGLYGDAVRDASARQKILAKPTGALGTLEDISVQLAGITGRVKNSAARKAIVIMSADNGVVEEGVASAPQTVTLSQTINFTKRLTGVGSLAKHFGIDLLVIDVGVKLPIPPSLYTDSMTEDGRLTDKIFNRRIACGTENLAKGPAMTREQAVSAIMCGIDAAEAVSSCGYDLMGVGEMGIGNTTTSACVLSALTDTPASVSVGRGGGLNDDGLSKKTAIVEEAAARCKRMIAGRGRTPDGAGQGAAEGCGTSEGCGAGLQPPSAAGHGADLQSAVAAGQGAGCGAEAGCGPSADDVIDVLASVGGFDICAMTGAYLGAALYRLPVVVDGYISAVAAMAAALMAPNCRNFMFPSHLSAEPGYKAAMDKIGLKPYFDLHMRLGEGSGCPISFGIIEAACAAMNGMATYDEGSIDADYLAEAEKGNFF